MKRLLLILFSILMSMPNAPAEKPNIVFFYVDDLGWSAVGYNGATYHLTPNIDNFARQSLVFDRAYAMPTCSPSRASLFTGKSPVRTGIYHVENFYKTPADEMELTPVKSGLRFDKDELRQMTLISDALQDEGYQTGYVGKWHISNDAREGGFSFNAGGYEQGSPKSWLSPYKNPALEDGPEGEYLADRLKQEAVSFIQRNKNGEAPFFLCYAPYLVHRPLFALEEDEELFRHRDKEKSRNNSVYAGMVYATDRVFQAVLDTLEKEGLRENTIVIFSSDNGVHNSSAGGAPLRGGKGTIYEGGVRVPTIINWPGVTTPGRTDALTYVTDWYPTLLDMAGATPSVHPLDGVSLSPILRGQSSSVRDTIHWHLPIYNGWKTNKESPLFQTPCSAILQGNFKLIHYYEDDRIELYNLADDLSETTNLVNQMPDKTRQLKAQLNRWLEDMDAPLPQPRTSSAFITQEKNYDN